MTWGFAFRLRQSVKGSLWLVPALGVVVGAILAIISVWVDVAVGIEGPWTYAPSTATSLLSAIIGAMAALTGFVVTVVVLAVQMATGTFSARYMRLWYRDAMLKVLLTLLVGTLSFSFMTMRFVGTASSPDLSVSLAALGVTLSLLLFVVYLDRFLHRLRPVAVAAYVAKEGRSAFEHWMRITRGPEALVHPRGPDVPLAPPSLVIRAPAAGVIQSVDVRGLAAFARHQHCLIVFQHPIGDFVPRDAELCSVYGDHVPPLAAERLGTMVALGVERTIEQDPMFAMRIMVDIADKALSPAVNDPTTAVQVLDHLAETLRLMGSAQLEDGTASADLPDTGVLMPLRRWEEILALGVTEIREYGAANIQVVRRLRALLLELDALVPPERRPAVRDEIHRLDATVERVYGSTEDIDLARAADAQGIGGPARRDGSVTVAAPDPGP